MRILQTCRSLGAGGIEAMVCGLANELAKADAVTVCTLKKPFQGDLFYNRLSPEVNKQSINQSDKDSPIHTVLQVVRFIQKGNFDIVHIHGFFYFYLLAILLLHKKTKFYYTVHSDAYKENNPWDLRLIKIKRLCFQKGWVKPITISHASKESFTKLYGCESKLIHNGTPRPLFSSENQISKYKITNGTKVFFHAGRICPEKNQTMLCRVFDRLIKEGEDVSLIIAGPFHVAASYDEIKPFFSNRIRYIGEQSDVPSLMHYSDAFCLTSHYEGMPIVLIEAFASGCTPICTAVGGVVNMITDGVNGFLAQDTSENCYYQTVRRFLKLPESKISEIRDNCIRTFEHYDINKVAQEYRRYFQQ